MKRPILSLFSGFFWFACSGSQPGPGAEGDGLRTESQFCVEWAKKACNDEVVAACNAASPNDCVATQKSACQVLVPFGYTSENAEDCLDAVEDAYQDAELTAEELDIVLNLGGACSRIFDGGQSEGGSCTSTLDCAAVDGFECVIKPGQADGTCQLPVEVGGGRRCSTPESVCEADFYCSGTNCDERLPAMEPCTGDVCAVGLRCAVATGAAETTCIPRLGIADPCIADDECGSGVCIGSTEADKICVSSVILTVRDPLCRELR
jgi:hypothetical protein